MNKLKPIFGNEENDRALADAAAASVEGRIASKELLDTTADSVPYPPSPKWVNDAIARQLAARTTKVLPA